MLEVSRGWHATLAAAPELVPTVHLSCLHREEDDEPRTVATIRRKVPCPQSVQCNHPVCVKLHTALGRLRSLSRRTLRVRLDGYDWTLVSCCKAQLLHCLQPCVHQDVHAVDRSPSKQCFTWVHCQAQRKLCSTSWRSTFTLAPAHSWPLQDGHSLKHGGSRNLLLASLQLLPAGITSLELNSYCPNTAAVALARFTALQRLELSGNAMEVEWAEPAAGAIVPLLRTLRLMYDDDELPPSLKGGVFNSLEEMPGSAASALMAASRLECLAIQVGRWTSDILTLCEALPALRDLRWALLPRHALNLLMQLI